MGLCMATAVTPQVALLRLCSECGEPIPVTRLKAKPNARQCVPCLEQMGDVSTYRRVEEQAGQIEKLFKDDAKSADADESDAECVFSTDDEEASGDTVTAPIVADVPAHELDELNVGSSDVEAHPPAQNQSDTIDPNYRGRVYLNRRTNQWYLTFCWHSRQRHKNIGSKEEFPTLDHASRAAEPLREWFRSHPEAFNLTGRVWHDEWREINAADLRAERESIAADIVKAKREESERAVEALFNALAKKRDARHYRKVAETVLGIYLDRKDTSHRTGGIRAVRYNDSSSAPYRNPSMTRATVSDFIADVEIAARSVLTKPLHKALFRLVYMETRYSVALALKCYASAVNEIHAALGREFVRRGISPTHEYFREFKAKQKPKQLR